MTKTIEGDGGERGVPIVPKVPIVPIIPRESKKEVPIVPKVPIIPIFSRESKKFLWRCHLLDGQSQTDRQPTDRVRRLRGERGGAPGGGSLSVEKGGCGGGSQRDGGECY